MNNVVRVDTDESAHASTFPVATGVMSLFCDRNGTGGYLQGWIKHAVFIKGLLTDAQAAAWDDFLSGRSTVAPTDTTGGTGVLGLTAVRSGGDVVITATSRFADSVKIAANTSSTPDDYPSDAAVNATTAITTRPFQKTFPAPPAGETLWVKAIAHFDVLGEDSTPATLAVPSLAGTFGGSSGGDGTITVPIVATDGSGNITGVAETTIDVAAFVPVTLLSGETFTLPANKQALFKRPITVRGTMVVRGDLIEVS